MDWVLEILHTLFIFNCENLENLALEVFGCENLSSLISLPGSITYLTTLEEFCIIKGKKLDLITIKKEKEEKNLVIDKSKY